MLMGQIPFDYCSLIRQNGIGLESRRLTECARVDDNDSEILKH